MEGDIHQSISLWSETSYHLQEEEHSEARILRLHIVEGKVVNNILIEAAIQQSHLGYIQPLSLNHSRRQKLQLVGPSQEIPDSDGELESQETAESERVGGYWYKGTKIEFCFTNDFLKKM